MKRIFLFLFFISFSWSLIGQFVNNGATVTIQAGAILKVESNFINQNSGTVTNNGTVDVSGNFTNSATFTSGAGSEVIFSGTGNSTVTPGTAQFQDVTMAKTNANAVLAGNMVVNGTLDFSTANNKINLGAFNLTIGANGNVTNAGSDKYVVATGAGRLIKTVTANGIVSFEVGDSDASTNYSPLNVDVTGTSFANANIAVNVVNAVHPDKPVTANDYLTRYWRVQSTNISGYDADFTGTFVPGNDVVGTQSSIDGAVREGSNWTYINSNHSGNTILASTTNSNVDFTGFTGRAVFNLTAYIQGYMNGGSMQPVLLNSGVPGATGSQCDTITIQLRNATAPYAVAHSYTGVMGTNGQLMCLFPATAIGNNYYIAVKHRNALETWSANTMTLVNNGSYNFSTGSAQAFGGNMKQVSGLWCFYSGNIDSNTPDDNIDLIDYPIWETDYNNLEVGYFRSDLNGDGNVDLIDYPIWEGNYNDLIGVIRP